MPDSLDDELVKADNELIESEPAKRPPGPWPLVALLLAAAVAVALYVNFRRAPLPEQTTTDTAPDSAAADRSRQPLGADAAPIDLPPLDGSDALVRQLVGHLSTHPQVSAWLATDGLIRNFTVVVANIAEGKSPAPLLRPLRPAERFEVTELGDELQIDSRSYERYTRLAGAVESIDAAGSARLYTLLKPRIEEAHAELGNPDVSFDHTLERALVRLLDTPVPDDAIGVELSLTGIGYRFADDSLENLSAAQKQLVRMGPRNARAIQQRLRAIAQALKIPAERLPAPK